MRLPAQRGPRTPLGRLNAAPAEVAEAVLLSCCGSRRWAGLLAGNRPYPDVHALLAAADEASYDLREVDVAEALAAESATHGPLGDGPGARAARTALRAAQAEYESTFGHAFVICLDELPPGEHLNETLSALRARLAHDAEQERAVAGDELRRLARTRLRRLLRNHLSPGGLSPQTPHGP
ncbi:2-oxo-4-hydroxy-4-carboxy-5-ureidoimidazoline decarboxylase [Streptomyces chumphonensis]|uniref:2-oxo-4-hydroxy-4-carboxy-5-ureidoimidazoline decarboxylase n=1 Tax=Streptomyces chumphonensis TaxID=1214925 RepID=UPI003D75FD7E